MFVLYSLKRINIDILNPPLHTQHNKGFGDINEDNPNAAIRLLGSDCNEGKIFNNI